MSNQLKQEFKESILNGTHGSFFLQTTSDGTIVEIIPEMEHLTKGEIPQNPKYHHLTVQGHIACVCDVTASAHPNNVAIKLAGVFHDILKGHSTVRSKNKQGQPNDLQHEEKGAEIVPAILQRLGYYEDTIKITTLIVKYHGFRIDPNAKSPRNSAIKAVNKWASHFNNMDELKAFASQLFDFMDCDARGFAPDFSNEVLYELPNVRSMVFEVMENEKFY